MSDLTIVDLLKTPANKVVGKVLRLIDDKSVLDDVFSYATIQDAESANWWDDIFGSMLFVKNFTISLAYSSGGYEGGGDVTIRVLEIQDTITKESVFIKAVGWYNSYAGSEYDDYTFARPYQFTETRYEPIGVKNEPYKDDGDPNFFMDED